MEIDDNEFFRKTAMQICGNLDIDRAMFHCLKILKQYIPADTLTLSITDLRLEVLRRIAVATSTKSYKLDDLFPVTKDTVTFLKEDPPPDIRIVNNPEKDPVAFTIFTALERQIPSSVYKPVGSIWDSSIMIMVLANKKETLGAIVLAARGQGQYHEEHLRLFSLLHEPFTIALSNTLRHRELEQIKNTLREDNQNLYQEMMLTNSTQIIGADYGLKSAMDMVKQVAPLNSPVVLLGETGVGKEIIANAIHNASPRKNGPFVKLNCGAIAENLIDSELFGHEKGAFTGASAQKRGRFERADNGTLFLDEIGELPLQAQIRLLRAVQNGEIERVGGSRTIMVNTRIIAATNRDLHEMVKTDQFREDLWFRLNVFSITIPPLRERQADIPLFLNHFIQAKSKSMGLHPVPKIGYGAIDRLKDYHWPGNVRELENVIERELVLSGGKALMFDKGLLPGVEQPAPPELEMDSLTTRLDEVVTHHIQHILRATDGRIYGKGGAADLLGVKSGTLRYRMDKLGIQYKKKRS